jgi:hypothetical protein
LIWSKAASARRLDTGLDLTTEDEMSAPATEASSHSPVKRVIEWLRAWRERQAGLAELDNLGEDGVRAIAADLGLGSAELRELAALGPDSAELMPRLLSALGLDPEVLRRAEPMVYRDLQRVCSCCADKGRCAHDLAEGSIAATYREFCPNAETVSALAAEDIEDARGAPGA